MRIQKHPGVQHFIKADNLRLLKEKLMKIIDFPTALV